MPITPSPNSDPEIWLIRHAAGVREAKELGRYLAKRPFALVLTSPLQRAHETCKLAGYGGAAQIEPDLSEWNYGAYEGRTSAQIQESVPGWTIWTRTPFLKP